MSKRRVVITVILCIVVFIAAGFVVFNVLNPRSDDTLTVSDRDDINEIWQADFDYDVLDFRVISRGQDYGGRTKLYMEIEYNDNLADISDDEWKFYGYLNGEENAAAPDEESPEDMDTLEKEKAVFEGNKNILPEYRGSCSLDKEEIAALGKYCADFDSLTGTYEMHVSERSATVEYLDTYTQQNTHVFFFPAAERMFVIFDTDYEVVSDWNK